RLLDPQGRDVARSEREATLPADCAPLEIERLRLTSTERGVYRLELTWECGERLVNTYDIQII
ncbi:MAG: hypothetical protein H7Z42_08775, partial [Roseiflexaceae bacterium]|nr:hypothetical protein [Roseiflexaceae bacterium]